uniref:Uncharacterized protein n=1 Tax=Nelumbo nucifera TaxID=4432 RepID=A0A822YHV3_NELNU|nr:TPA_asm: hypothetical protein HUJ06_009416 [Nelumbo nucifera]
MFNSFRSATSSFRTFMFYGKPHCPVLLFSFLLIPAERKEGGGEGEI